MPSKGGYADALLATFETACHLVEKCHCWILAWKKMLRRFSINFFVILNFGIDSKYSTWKELIVSNFSPRRDRFSIKPTLENGSKKITENFWK